MTTGYCCVLCKNFVITPERDGLCCRHDEKVCLLQKVCDDFEYISEKKVISLKDIDEQYDMIFGE